MIMNNSSPKRRYYVDGSTIRSIDHYSTSPKRRPSAPEPGRRVKQALVTHPSAARKAEASLAFTPAFTLLAISLVFAVVLCCSMIIYTESKIKQQKSHIAELQSQIQQAKTDNAILEENINKMYTLEDIKHKAMTELGMIYSEKGQISYYEPANEDYVNQFNDVPEADN